MGTDTSLAGGWAFLRSVPGLRALLAYTALESFTVGLVMVLAAPFILAAHDEKILGGLMSCAMLGMVVGSAIIMLRGAPARLISTILLLDLVMAAGIALMGASLALPPVFFGAFIALAAAGFSAACNQTLWQAWVPVEMQGRVFALRHIAQMGAIPVAAVVGGLLADVLGPAMQPGGALAAALGGWLGEGPGRGIALVFVGDALLLALLATGVARALKLQRFDRLPK